MAHRRSRPLPTTGGRAVCPQVWCWLQLVQVACKPRVRFPQPGSCWRCVFLRSGYRQHEALVLRQCGTLYALVMKRLDDVF